MNEAYPQTSMEMAVLMHQKNYCPCFSNFRRVGVFFSLFSFCVARELLADLIHSLATLAEILNKGRRGSRLAG